MDPSLGDVLYVRSLKAVVRDPRIEATFGFKAPRGKAFVMILIAGRTPPCPSGRRTTDDVNALTARNIGARLAPAKG